MSNPPPFHPPPQNAHTGYYFAPPGTNLPPHQQHPAPPPAFSQGYDNHPVHNGSSASAPVSYTHDPSYPYPYDAAPQPYPANGSYGNPPSVTYPHPSDYPYSLGPPQPYPSYQTSASPSSYAYSPQPPAPAQAPYSPFDHLQPPSLPSPSYHHSQSPITQISPFPPAVASPIPVPLPQTSQPQQSPAKPPTSLRVRLKVPPATAPVPEAPPAAPTPTTVDPSQLAMPANSTSSRPMRNARVQAQAQMQAYRELSPSPPPTGRRTAKRPVRYGGEDDFEEKLMPTSPVIASPEKDDDAPYRRTSGRAKRKVVDPDESEEDDDEEDDAPGEDEDDEGEYVDSSARRGAKPGPRRAFPARATRASLNGVGEASTAGQPSASTPATNGRRGGRAPAKRRPSGSPEGSFDPDADPTDDDDVPSEDPLDGGFDLDEHEMSDDFDALESRSASPAPRRVTRRSTRQSTRSTRRRGDHTEEEEEPKRQLRERTTRVNYQLPPIDITAEELNMAEAIAAVSRPGGARGGARGVAGGARFGGAAGKVLPWSARGRDLARAMGEADTSDSDLDFQPTLNAAGGAGGAAALAGQGTGNRPVGGPSDVPNFGRINPKSSTADADPLGVSMDISFDAVGGLDDHINQLKEMVALPLLYPELFQQFKITPPRGVLFHGPPGTGKTLLARALAASCSQGNTKIAFFMRKGADVLSKWVGEAERQLRMLFEEARAAQPSIIFFDEIDGLAPVRSSKQDQIHASLVSTLLALMDGMDGRGQVIVIGATNRPDAVDPALRRPGRFDREFYFPLPNKAARKKIIGINTRHWDPKLEDDVVEELAGLTKGYGGADLRALCTEAALNAIQRKYPQIYKTSDRLLLEPQSIHVSPRDFMMSIKKIVPSSARSTASPAVALPDHLAPLLGAQFTKIKAAIDKALPRRKKLTALEEAEFEDEGGVEAGFGHELMVQSMDKARTYRPRILVHGKAGMGQAHLGPAVLHHLEGFHVQSLDLGGLLGDATRTVEAALVQTFTEARRHQPSVLFIPSLHTWTLTLSDTARQTFRTLLDGIGASDPILLLAICEGEGEQLGREARRWFGVGGKEGWVEVTRPSLEDRKAYFHDLLQTLHRPPTEWPDAMPRRKRILPILPAAPPLPPRQPTEAELAREAERDANARTMMTMSFISLVQDFLKRYRRVSTTVREDIFAVAAQEAERIAQEFALASTADIPNGHLHSLSQPNPSTEPLDSGVPAADLPLSQPAAIAVDMPVAAQLSAETSAAAADPTQTGANSVVDGTLPDAAITAPAPAAVPTPVKPFPTLPWQPHAIDIDVMHTKLIRHKYLHPSDFLHDISLIEENASRLGDADRQARLAEMGAHARMHVSGFDQKWMPEFEAYKERALRRKAEREKRKREAKARDAAAAGDVAVVREEAEAEAGAGGQKRARSRDGDGEEEEGGAVPDGERAEKRHRLDNGDIVMGEVSSLSSTLPDVNGPTTAAPSQTDTLPPTTDPTETFLHHISSDLVTPDLEHDHLPTVPAPNQPARVEHPPFVLPAEGYEALASELTHSTGKLNVEQLEQLRAKLFDAVWAGRAAWDKGEVVGRMRGLVKGWVEEVEEMLRDEEGEEGDDE